MASETEIYSGVFKNFTGRVITVAVESSLSGHVYDLNTAASELTGMKVGQFHINGITRIDALDGFEPIKGMAVNGKQWGWAKY